MAEDPGALPREVEDLLASREAARAARDFASADLLRERIRSLGFEITDSDSGPVLLRAEPRPGPRPDARLEPGQVETLLHERASFEASVHWLVQGWPEDIARGIASIDRHCGLGTVQHVVVDVRREEPGVWPEGTDVVALRPGTGWAAARNAGLSRAAGELVLVMDGSIEATGDVLRTLRHALADPTVGVTGPFGIATADLREFHESDGPEVDAIEGYLMAFRRELLLDGLRFDEKFRFYRTADIEFSFQVKALGLRATVTRVPVRRHEHRIWAATPEEERTRLSKRNFYRFLDRWRGRTDLLVAPGAHEH